MSRDLSPPPRTDFAAELAIVLDGVLDAFALARKRGLDSSATRRRVEDLRAQLDRLRAPAPKDAA